MIDGRRGFSVVELMFVIVIISIVATVAVPTFLGTMHTDRLAQATGEIRQIFERARARAVLRNTAVRVAIVRQPAGPAPNLRIDESHDGTCSGFQRIATRTSPPPNPAEADAFAPCTAWIATERHRCGLAEVHISGTLAPGYYRAAGVTVERILTGEPGGSWTVSPDVLVVCVNRRGRLLRWTGTDWTPIGGGLLFRLDRREGGPGGPFMGLVKEVYIPQGGIAGVLR